MAEKGKSNNFTAKLLARSLKANLESFAAKVGAELGPITGGFVPSAGPIKRTVSGNVMVSTRCTPSRNGKVQPATS